MTTYKAKKVISKMLRYYAPERNITEGSEAQLIQFGKNQGMLHATAAFINEFKGLKRAKLEEYVIEILKDKGGRTD